MASPNTDPGADGTLTVSEPDSTVAGATAPASEDEGRDAPSFVAHLLGRNPGTSDHEGAPETTVFGEAVVDAWSGHVGTLADGRPARLAASCLLRPAPGDRVVVWSSGETWVLSVLERPDNKTSAVLASEAPLAIEAPRIALASKAVHVVAQDFLTSVRNRHAVEHTRTETSKLRVSQVGTDIRRVTTADESVEGTLLQRAGTWISSTTRDARFRARAFLFD